MSAIFKNLITLLVLAALAGAGYYFFVLQSSSDLSGGSMASDRDFLNQQFLNRIQRLESVEISRDFFEDPRFRSLISFSTEPDEVSSGRSNPFSR